MSEEIETFSDLFKRKMKLEKRLDDVIEKIMNEKEPNASLTKEFDSIKAEYDKVSNLILDQEIVIC